MMNTGKIMIGFSLILLSVAMMVSPSGATGTGGSCEVGPGITLPGAASPCPIVMHHDGAAGFMHDGPRNATHQYER